MQRVLPILLVATMLAGCSSTGNLGLMTRPGANPGRHLTGEQRYQEVGPVEGRSCRYFLAAIIPWGDSSPSAAMEKALAGSDADAILNASVTASLYGFVPVYNVFAFACTTVKGTAIRFVDGEMGLGD